jgi:hypothetical protein
MWTTQPPAFATWLLRHLGSSPHNDSIIGDLIEQYEQAPSPVWYWKQCLKSIVVGLLNECRTHKWLTVRALLTGWTIPLVIFPRSFEPTRELLFALEVWSRWWRHSWLLPLAWTSHAVLLCIIAGWLIARFHRPYQIPMVLMFAVSCCCVTWPMFLYYWAMDSIPWWPTYVLPVLEPISIMFGGLFRSHPDRPPSTIKNPVVT